MIFDSNAILIGSSLAIDQLSGFDNGVAEFHRIRGNSYAQLNLDKAIDSYKLCGAPQNADCASSAAILLTSSDLNRALKWTRAGLYYHRKDWFLNHIASLIYKQRGDQSNALHFGQKACQYRAAFDDSDSDKKNEIQLLFCWWIDWMTQFFLNI